MDREYRIVYQIDFIHLQKLFTYQILRFRKPIGNQTSFKFQFLGSYQSDLALISILPQSDSAPQPRSISANDNKVSFILSLVHALRAVVFTALRAMKGLFAIRDGLAASITRSRAVIRRLIDYLVRATFIAFGTKHQIGIVHFKCFFNGLLRYN